MFFVFKYQSYIRTAVCDCFFGWVFYSYKYCNFNFLASTLIQESLSPPASRIFWIPALPQSSRQTWKWLWACCFWRSDLVVPSAHTSDPKLWSWSLIGPPLRHSHTWGDGDKQRTWNANEYMTAIRTTYRTDSKLNVSLDRRQCETLIYFPFLVFLFSITW